MRSPRLFSLGAVGACSCALLVACVIADPPTDPPLFPRFRPTIVRDSCVPNANQILASFPDKFVIPVELVDPSTSFEWRLYYDYDPESGNGLVTSGTSRYDPERDSRTIRLIETVQRPPVDLKVCHTIEVVVAVRFQLGADFPGTLKHAPDESGGDSVTWFYAPDGDTRSCGVVAPDASTADASSDAGTSPGPADASDGGG